MLQFHPVLISISTQADPIDLTINKALQFHYVIILTSTFVVTKDWRLLAQAPISSCYDLDFDPPTCGHSHWTRGCSNFILF
jgi:hypothetical protein